MTWAAFLKRYEPISLLVLATAIWMTWEATQWAIWFSTGNARNGVEMAAIIAAVQMPVTMFTKAVFEAVLKDGRIER